MNVAQHIIQKCGGARKVATITGRTLSVVHRWSYPRERGGTDGVIPAEAQNLLWAAAQRNEVELTAEDFFPQTQAAE